MTGKLRILWVIPALATILAAGCSRNPNTPAKISGRVTKGGAPITAGTITFSVEGKGFASGALGPDGKFEIGDLPEGEAVVTIETESANPDKQQPEYMSQGGGAGPGDMAGKYGGKKAVTMRPPADAKGPEMSPIPESAKGVSRGTYTKIPDRYSDPAKSGLKVTLKRGSNKKDFDLTD